jgi:hypothetical protein
MLKLKTRIKPETARVEPMMGESIMRERPQRDDSRCGRSDIHLTFNGRGDWI